MITLQDIVVVTVTYGERWELLFNSLKSCIREGLRNFIIVGNGVSYDLTGRIEKDLPDINISVTLSDINKGSAYGFRTGLVEAVSSKQHYIMLLDDDAELQNGCIDRLMKSYNEIVKDYGHEKTVVGAIRYEHISDIKEGVLQHSLKQKNAFRRFHLFDLPRRILRRYGFKKQCDYCERINVPYTVYSGLLFHKDMIDRYGLPNLSFVLYGDDLEFTYRISSQGGMIFIITDALISDIQMSWWCRKSFGNPLDALILGGNDKVVYYAFRNEVYFETFCLKRRGIIYSLHKFIFMTALFLNSIRRNKIDRFKILFKALIDGQNGRLGLNPKFPLGEV